MQNPSVPDSIGILASDIISPTLPQGRCFESTKRSSAWFFSNIYNNTGHTCRPAEAARLFERTLETIQRQQQQHASDTKPLKARIHHSATHNGLCSRGLGEKEKATPLRTHQSNTTKAVDRMNGRHFRQKFCGSIQPCNWGMHSSESCFRGKSKQTLHNPMFYFKEDEPP